MADNLVQRNALNSFVSTLSLAGSGDPLAVLQAIGLAANQEARGQMNLDLDAVEKDVDQLGALADVQKKVNGFTTTIDGGTTVKLGDDLATGQDLLDSLKDCDLSLTTQTRCALTIETVDKNGNTLSLGTKHFATADDWAAVNSPGTSYIETYSDTGVENWSHANTDGSYTEYFLDPSTRAMTATVSDMNALKAEITAREQPLMTAVSDDLAKLQAAAKIMVDSSQDDDKRFGKARKDEEGGADKQQSSKVQALVERLQRVSQEIRRNERNDAAIARKN